MTNAKEQSRDKPLFLAGNCNLSHIDWKNKNIKPGGKSSHSQELLEIAEEVELEQMQMNPTRENNNLDLFFTRHLSFVKSVKTIPGISVHDMVVICNIVAVSNERQRSQIHETVFILFIEKTSWADICNAHEQRKHVLVI